MSFVKVLAKRNLYKGLPKSIYEHNFDGVDDLVSIDNSNTVGNPYDFERTDPFTIAFKFSTNNYNTNNFPHLFSKRENGNGVGYYSAIESGFLVFGIVGAGGATNMRLDLNIIPLSTDRIIVLSYTGSSSVNGLLITLCDEKGIPITVVNTAINSSTITGTIKNISKLHIGCRGDVNFFHGGRLGNFSIFNTALTGVQINELAPLIVANSVDKHSLYTNCVGYWKQYANKLINIKNSSYDGTYGGFVNP